MGRVYQQTFIAVADAENSSAERRRNVLNAMGIMTSSCTTGQASGFGIRACALVSTPQLPVSYFNEGYPGRNSIGFCSCGIWDIEHFKPQAALIQTWSGNEPWTRDRKGRGTDHGVLPIVWRSPTPMPQIGAGK